MSQSRKAKYRSAVRQTNEGLKIFAKRLEHLYRKAYLHQDVDGGDLKRRLTSALPSATVEVMERDLALIRATSSRRNTWADVLTVLEIQDDASRRGARNRTREVPATQDTWAGVVKKGHFAMPVQSNNPIRPTVFRRSPVKTQRESGRRSSSGEKKASPRNWSTSPGSQLCKFCKRGGHNWDSCWRRLDKCLRCGSDNHRIAHCPSASLRTPRRYSPRTERVMRVSESKSARDSSASGSESHQKSERSRKPRSRRARKQRRQSRSSSGSSSDGKSLNRQTLG